MTCRLGPRTSPADPSLPEFCVNPRSDSSEWCETRSPHLNSTQANSFSSTLCVTRARMEEDMAVGHDASDISWQSSSLAWYWPFGKMMSIRIHYFDAAEGEDRAFGVTEVLHGSMVLEHSRQDTPEPRNRFESSFRSYEMEVRSSKD